MIQFLKKYLLFLLCMAPTALWAQQGHYNAFDAVQYDTKKQLHLQDLQRHSAVLPILNKDVIKYCGSDSLRTSGNKGFLGTVKNLKPLGFSKKNLKIAFYPTLDLSGGAESKDFRMFGGGAIGANLTADLGKRFSIGGYGRLSQYSFPGYLEKIIAKQRVVPGCGYAVPSALGGHYFWDWDVYANYEFLKYFNLEAGMGRNFWGDGYRSFFLSDQSFSYPYFKITTSFWKIKYVNLYAQLKDMRTTGSGLWSSMENKYGSFHFLSWDVSKRLNIGFFEAIIWQNEDSLAHRGFDINYLNPVIFYRPVEFSVGSPDNSLMGFSAKVKVAKKNFFYGQFLLDDIIWGEFSGGSINRIKHWIHPSDSVGAYGYWTNKQAWQLGFVSYDIFKIRDLDFQLEYNAARPYTFSHRMPGVNYSQYNEALAHPAGANFQEVLGFLKYRTGNFHFQLMGLFRETGIDTIGTHYGQDIFQSTFDTYYPELDNIPVSQYNNNIGQGIKTRLYYGSVKASWLFNKAMNLRAEAEVAVRRQSSSIATNTGVCFMLGLKTSWFQTGSDR